MLRYDQLGHGRSEVRRGPYTVELLGRELLALLDGLGVERFSFCGLSLGGTVGMWLGANAGDRLDRLVLAGTSAYFGPPERWIERAEIVRAEGMEPLADATMGRWFTPAFAGVAAFREMLVATPPEGYAALLRRAPRLGLPRRARLGLGADARARRVARTRRRLPDHGAADRGRDPRRASSTVIPDAAHLLNVEQPEAFDARGRSDHLTGEERA